jgi:hypothetical protein
MAEPFYRVGEPRGPFFVVADSFEVLPSGRTVETVVDSGRNRATTYGWDDDREYYQICQRQGDVLVPYTIRHQKTEAGAPGATWEYVGNSPYDYWRALCEWWTPRDFTIIEHDVAATPEIFAEFAACPHLWCTFKYSNHSDADAEAWKYGILGCTRFRKNLMRKLPDVVKNLEWRYRDWHVMSTGLGMALRKQRFEPHVHGVVDHHRMMDLGGVAELMAS